MELIIGIVGGAFASWLITHTYYKKSTVDLERLFNKFDESTRETILSSDKEKLSIKELNALLEEKTIDHDTNNPLPYIACPKCGSKNLNFSSHYDENDSASFVNCPNPKCKWTEMA